MPWPGIEQHSFGVQDNNQLCHTSWTKNILLMWFSVVSFQHALKSAICFCFPEFFCFFSFLFFSFSEPIQLCNLHCYWTLELFSSYYSFSSFLQYSLWKNLDSFELNGILARGKAIKIWWHIMNWHVICNCAFYPDLYLRELFSPGSAREIVTASFFMGKIHLDQGCRMEMTVFSEQIPHVFIGKLNFLIMAIMISHTVYDKLLLWCTHNARFITSI